MRRLSTNIVPELAVPALALALILLGLFSHCGCATAHAVARDCAPTTVVQAENHGSALLAELASRGEVPPSDWKNAAVDLLVKLGFCVVSSAARHLIGDEEEPAMASNGSPVLLARRKSCHRVPRRHRAFLHYLAELEVAPPGSQSTINPFAHTRR